jgi:hypothetical protein
VCPWWRCRWTRTLTPSNYGYTGYLCNFLMKGLFLDGSDKRDRAFQESYVKKEKVDCTVSYTGCWCVRKVMQHVFCLPDWNNGYRSLSSELIFYRSCKPQISCEIFRYISDRIMLIKNFVSGQSMCENQPRGDKVDPQVDETTTWRSFMYMMWKFHQLCLEWREFSKVT